MGGSWDLVIVGVLVAGAGVWAVRALVRSLKRPGGCSSCGSSGDCPLVKGPDGGDATGCGLTAEGADVAKRDSRRQGVALH